MMLERLKTLHSEALDRLTAATSIETLKEWENLYLGRKSEFNTLLKGLKDLPAEDRKAVGIFGNQAKHVISVKPIPSGDGIISLNRLARVAPLSSASH